MVISCELPRRMLCQSWEAGSTREYELWDEELWPFTTCIFEPVINVSETMFNERLSIFTILTLRNLGR